MLRHFDRNNTIVHQDDDATFENRAEDIDIIRTLAAEDPKPVLITVDISQTRNPGERFALRESGMSVVFFRGGYNDLKFHHQAIKLVWIWPRIVEECLRCKVPTVFEISPKLTAEKIDIVCPTSQIFAR
jgi:hypothetical protein